jgi:hypothetical protein
MQFSARGVNKENFLIQLLICDILHVLKGSYRRQHVSITKPVWLLLWRLIIIYFSENHMEPICTFINYKAGGLYNCHLIQRVVCINIYTNTYL